MTASYGEPSFELSAGTHVLRALFVQASGVVPSKEIMAVLKNFLVEAVPGRIRVSASDLELSIIATTELGQISVPGRIVLPAKKMIEIVNTSSGQEMTITVVSGIATVVCGKARWSLKLADGTDYPPLPELTDISLYEVDRGKFLGGLESVRYAAGSETAGTRRDFAMIDVTDGQITACDGVRFQQAQLGDEAFPLSLQIPISAVDDLLKLLRLSPDLTAIRIGESENHIVFQLHENVFVVNKMMAQFPDIATQLLGPAKNNKYELFIAREDFLEVIRRVRINSDPESSALVLRLTTDQVVVASRDKFGNTAEESVSASWKLPARTLVVNHKFLTDMLNMYDGNTCRLLLGDDVSKTKRAPIMLSDATTGAIGLIQQMRPDFVLD